MQIIQRENKSRNTHPREQNQRGSPKSGVGQASIMDRVRCDSPNDQVRNLFRQIRVHAVACWCELSLDRFRPQATGFIELSSGQDLEARFELNGGPAPSLRLVAKVAKDIQKADSEFRERMDRLNGSLCCSRVAFAPGERVIFGFAETLIVNGTGIAVIPVLALFRTFADLVNHPEIETAVFQAGGRMCGITREW